MKVSNPNRFNIVVDEEYDNIDPEQERSSSIMNSPLMKIVFPIILGAVIIIGVGAIVFFVVDNNHDDDWDNTVLIISLDGFRNRFLKEKNGPELFPVLWEMMQTGIYADSLRPSFPTLTFPNHYTIVTGLYPSYNGIAHNTMGDPSYNGIVHNTMWDPSYEQLFTMATTDPKWWDGQPLWLTNQDQGFKSGTYFWPGSDREIDGEYPTYWEPYNGDVPYEQRCDQIIAWLGKPKKERPTFLTLYFDEPDHTEHTYGPDDDDKIDPVLTMVDNTLGYLFGRMERKGYDKKVDVIVVSDHGQTTVTDQRVVHINEYLNISSVTQMNNPDFDSTNVDCWGIASGVVSTCIPAEGKMDEVLSILDTIPNIQVYTNETIAENPDWNYCCNTRIPQIVVVADLGYYVTNNGFFLRGNHGYDNMEDDMQAIFVAKGPHFRQGTTPTLENINVYQMICDILGIKAAPNNATMTSEEIAALYLKK